MDLKQFEDPATITAIYKNYKDKRTNDHRPHLGGSRIGTACKRALWYEFRHAWSPNFDGRMLRLFETGDREEDRIVSNLRAVGVTVWERDPDTGQQVRFSAAGGHFGLSLDGVGEGFAESKKPHTLEFKTMSDKNFKAMKNLGCQKSKPIYWAQCQIGMYLSDIDRCYFFCVNKNTDEMYGERIKLDKTEAKGLIDKANEVIFSDLPPNKITEDPSNWECKFCNFWAVCHGCKIPEVSCRTCSHVTPEKDGTWSCAKGKPAVTCDEHLYIPQIMPNDFEVMDAGDDFVEYEDQDSGEVIRNQGNSREIFEGRMR